jgi:predicted RND superfamily exporter protein
MPPQGSKLGIVAVSGAFMLVILALLFVVSEIAYSLNEWMVSR